MDRQRTFPSVVVMGVSGSGKTTVGQALAQQLGVPFLDGDGLHPEANAAKMAAGTPLDDADRWPWLQVIGRKLHEADGLVIACSALKRTYRDLIRAEASGAVFVHLSGDAATLGDRLARRSGHFMPASLLSSQLETLEPLEDDEPGGAVDISDSVETIVAEALELVRGRGV